MTFVLSLSKKLIEGVNEDRKSVRS